MLIITSILINLLLTIKTGTLTETDIDLAGTIPIQEGEFRKPVVQLATLPETHPLLHSIATCHSLIRVHGQLNGYSIDRKMFDATKWTFNDGPPGVNSNYGVETPYLISSPLWNDKRDSSYSPTVEIAVLKRFPFESTVKRMTVSPFNNIYGNSFFFNMKNIFTSGGFPA